MTGLDQVVDSHSGYLRDLQRQNADAAFRQRPLSDPATRSRKCERNYADESGTRPEQQSAYGVWEGDKGTMEISTFPTVRIRSAVICSITPRPSRDAYALYTQGVWDINELFTLTFGIRYARDS